MVPLAQLNDSPKVFMAKTRALRTRVVFSGLRAIAGVARDKLVLSSKGVGAEAPPVRREPGGHYDTS